jgi:hypothetical protein
MEPQPEHVWLVTAGATAGVIACARFLALAAWKVRMVRNALHPASRIDLARWWLLTIVATCKASGYMVAS